MGIDIMYSSEPVKPIFSDETGKLWMGKRIKSPEDPIREYLGSELQNVLAFENVISPRIRRCKDFDTFYLVEYFPDLIFYGIDFTEACEIRDCAENPAMREEAVYSRRWCADYYLKTGELLEGIWKTPSIEQKQHLVGCLLNNDYDRTRSNYMWRGNQLVVLDHEGGHDEFRFDKEFGAMKISLTDFIIPENTLEDFQIGIEKAKSLKPGVFKKIVKNSGLTGKEAKSKVNELLDNQQNIESNLEFLIKTIKEQS